MRHKGKLKLCLSKVWCAWGTSAPPPITTCFFFWDSTTKCNATTKTHPSAPWIWPCCSERMQLIAWVASSRALLTDDVKVRNTSGSVRAFPSFDESLLIPIDYNKNRVHRTTKQNNGGTLCWKMLVQAMTLYVNSHVGVFRSRMPPPPPRGMSSSGACLQVPGLAKSTSSEACWPEMDNKNKKMLRGAKLTIQLSTGLHVPRPFWRIYIMPACLGTCLDSLRFVKTDSNVLNLHGIKTEIILNLEKSALIITFYVWFIFKLKITNQFKISLKPCFSFFFPSYKSSQVLRQQELVVVASILKLTCLLLLV